MTPRSLAPAGAPITTGDLVRWLGAPFHGASGAAAFATAIRARFDVPYAHPVATGRAGMTLLLRAMRRLAPADRTEVVIPSYTCYSVAASVVKAGLRPRLADISPETLDYTPSALATTDWSRVLAVVATNLFGLPGDLPGLIAHARAHGVLVIDDAAQSMGARVDGRWSGTWGDAGLFSVDKGKPVSAIDGGVVVTARPDLDEALAAEFRGTGHAGTGQVAAHVAKALVYAVFLRPRLYWIPDRVPQLELGRTVFTTDFPLDAIDPALAALAAITLDHLEPYIRARAATAAALTERLGGLAGVRLMTPHRLATPGYLRFPLLLPDTATRERARLALKGAGIGATGSYPASLADVAELAPHLAGPVDAGGGRAVAARLLTLPTHPFVTPGDVTRMVRVLAGVLDGAAVAATGDSSGERKIVCAE